MVAVERHADEYSVLESELLQRESLWDRPLFVCSLSKLVKRLGTQGGAPSMTMLAQLWARIESLSLRRLRVLLVL